MDCRPLRSRSDIQLLCRMNLTLGVSAKEEGRQSQSRPNASWQDQELCDFLKGTMLPIEAWSYFNLGWTKPEQPYIDQKFILLWAEGRTRWLAEVPSSLMCLLRLKSPHVPVGYPDEKLCPEERGERSVSEVSVNPLLVEGASVPIAPVLLLFPMCDLFMLLQYNP